MTAPSEQSAGVRASRGAPHVNAECETCRERWDGHGTSNADNARAAAKRHAVTTGHTVFVERSIGTYFNNPVLR